MIRTATQIQPITEAEFAKEPVVETKEPSIPTTDQLVTVVADLKQRLHKLEAEGLNRPLQSELRSTIEGLEGVLEAVLNDPEIDTLSSESEVG